MAPHQGYPGGETTARGFRQQVRALVTACHQAGLEVLLMWSTPHPSEGNHERSNPQLARLCRRPLLQQERVERRYQDVTGCGNTIAATGRLWRRP